MSKGWPKWTRKRSGPKTAVTPRTPVSVRQHQAPPTPAAPPRAPGPPAPGQDGVGERVDRGVPLVEDAAEVEGQHALEVVEEQRPDEPLERELELRVGDVVVPAHEEVEVERGEASRGVGRGDAPH